MSRKLKLYIAQSIDGYIADKNGGIDFLTACPNPNNLDYGYKEFTNTIDTVIMGRKTYETILGFNIPWPYADCQNYIVTSNPQYNIATENTELISDKLIEKIKSLKQEDGKDIWLVGGGVLVSELLNHNLIDEMIIYTMPIIIGEGLPLFPNNPKETIFNLIRSNTLDTGVVELVYQPKSI